jgi:hypothetical protein
MRLRTRARMQAGEAEANDWKLLIWKNDPRKVEAGQQNEDVKASSDGAQPKLEDEARRERDRRALRLAETKVRTLEGVVKGARIQAAK